MQALSDSATGLNWDTYCICVLDDNTKKCTKVRLTDAFGEQMMCVLRSNKATVAQMLAEEVNAGSVRTAGVSLHTQNCVHHISSS